MKNKELGKEPVYPVHHQDLDYNENGIIVEAKNGLTKREYFAGLAMQSMITSWQSELSDRFRKALLDDLVREFGKDITVYEGFSKKAIVCADELLKQLGE